MNRLPDPRERPWLTVDELSGITGEGTKALRAAIGAGHIPSIRIGRYVRVPTAALLTQCGLDATDDELGVRREGKEGVRCDSTL